MAAKNFPGKREDKVEPVRKSKQVPKKHVTDGDFDEDEDDELQYLEKLKNSKTNLAYGEDNEGSSKKRRKLASVSNLSTAKPTENVKKSWVDKGFEDIDYEEDHLML